MVVPLAAGSATGAVAFLEASSARPGFLRGGAGRELRGGGGSVGFRGGFRAPLSVRAEEGSAPSSSSAAVTDRRPEDGVDGGANARPVRPERPAERPPVSAAPKSAFKLQPRTAGSPAPAAPERDNNGQRPPFTPADRSARPSPRFERPDQQQSRPAAFPNGNGATGASDRPRFELRPPSSNGHADANGSSNGSFNPRSTPLSLTPRPAMVVRKAEEDRPAKGSMWETYTSSSGKTERRLKTNSAVDVSNAPSKAPQPGAPMRQRAPLKKGETKWKKEKDGDDFDGLRRRKAEGLPDQAGGKLRNAAARARSRKERAAKALSEAPVRVDFIETTHDGLTVTDLSSQLAVPEAEVVKTLFMKGIMATMNQVLSVDAVKTVAAAFELECEVVEERTDLAKKTEFMDDYDLEHLQSRPPVVTIMGHVDHGKTSLLDYIRSAKVAQGEAGGITQGIGAYRVETEMQGSPATIVFLDTPGHQAFSAMRARGAKVTDIAVVVVAADDGVRPQTQEAISHAKAAGVPIIIAINKVDKVGANRERVMQELSELGLLPEEWGGDTPMVPVSALTGESVDTLLETIMLVAEIGELQANPDTRARGTVIEAHLDKSLGPVATVIVQNGTLRLGDAMLCGEVHGKIRTLVDDRREPLEAAGPSMPVLVAGLSGVPLAGDEFEVSVNEKVARETAEATATLLRQERLKTLTQGGKVTLANLADSADADSEGYRVLNVVLKVDMSGSAEAVRSALQVLPQDKVSLRFLMAAAGDISDSDVDLAAASNAVVLGFGVSAGSSVSNSAESKGVEIRSYDVIYRLVDDVRAAMEGMLEPFQERQVLGQAEVRALFGAGSRTVAGCMITSGKLQRNCRITVMRNGKQVYDGVLDSLRRGKESVKEVSAGLECGISSDNFSEWKEGDVVEAYLMISKRRTLEEASSSPAPAAPAQGKVPAAV
eukprot:jgi/Chlat1/294/Chrsp1S03172